MGKILFTTLIIIAVTLSANAQQDASKQNADGSGIMIVPDEIQEKISDFYKLLIRAEVDKAFNDFLKNSPIKSEEEQIKQLKAQTKRSLEIYGLIQGFEFVSSEKASESFIRVRFLALHKKYPMRWIFTFYKPPAEEWIVTNVKFDDNSEFFFED